MNHLAKIHYFTLLGKNCTFWQKSHFSKTKSHFFPIFPTLFQMPCQTDQTQLILTDDRADKQTGAESWQKIFT